MAFAASLLLVAASAAAQSPEYQLKAAFIYNFAKFAEWPPEAFASEATPLSLCIQGQDSFGAALDAVARKSVQSRTISLRRGLKDTELKDCHILYSNEGDTQRARETLASLGHLAVLTIGDRSGFLDAGGMVELVTADNRVQFEVNLEALKRANLRLSAQVLKLAKAVHSGRNKP
jgi:YfiR/HmsC-like